jgi:hypothetical protein
VTQPYSLAALVLSLGDRLATRGPRTRLRGLRVHQELAREMAEALIGLGDVPPASLVPGDVLAHRLGIAPGPILGELVEALQEEQAAGAVTDADGAEAFARAWLTERVP